MIEKRREVRIENHLLIQEIKRLFNTGKESVTFIVRGYSMRPFLEHERDKVVLAPPHMPKVGDVVLAEFAKERYALHRVIKIEGENFIMRGDGNPLDMKESFSKEQIIGIAKAFIRKERVISTDGRIWKTYSYIWNLLRPTRRILLAVHRRIIKYI